MSVRIMVVDDDPAAREILQEKLGHEGYDVETAESAEAALGKVKKVDPSVIITDLRMPGMDGLELMDKVREHMDEVDVIVCTGHEDMNSAVAAMKAGAFDYIVKPVDLSHVADLVDRCLREQELAREVRKKEEEEEEGADGEKKERPLVVGRDPRMIEIYKMIGVLARNRTTVLIRGETGSGKEMVARAIHSNSAHSDEPFMAVNCTALTDTLLESELFGHVKGAFTGATSSRKGYFELAGSGTIFLDEIGDTSPEFQSKLLRVLQERQFYPVGGEQPRRTEARVIAATHRPIEDMVEEGDFREDLYFRLKVVEICVPPLRDRRNDIPLLADHLLERIREETGQPVKQVSEEAMEMLLKYDWPGNVRELENALTRGAILSRGSAIAPEHVSLGVDAIFRNGGSRRDDVLAVGTESPLDDVVALHVKRVMKHTKGDRDRAAEILDVSKSHLGRLINKHGIETE